MNFGPCLNPKKFSSLACMQVLVEKARNEAQEAQRILLAALNGLAGLMILDSDRAQAVALYRKARASQHLSSTQLALPYV